MSHRIPSYLQEFRPSFFLKSTPDLRRNPVIKTCIDLIVAEGLHTTARTTIDRIQQANNSGSPFPRKWDAIREFKKNFHPQERSAMQVEDWSEEDPPTPPMHLSPMEDVSEELSLPPPLLVADEEELIPSSSHMEDNEEPAPSVTIENVQQQAPLQINVAPPSEPPEPPPAPISPSLREPSIEDDDASQAILRMSAPPSEPPGPPPAPVEPPAKRGRRMVVPQAPNVEQLEKIADEEAPSSSIYQKDQLKSVFMLYFKAGDYKVASNLLAEAAERMSDLDLYEIMVTCLATRKYRVIRPVLGKQLHRLCGALQGRLLITALENRDRAVIEKILSLKTFRFFPSEDLLTILPLSLKCSGEIRRKLFVQTVATINQREDDLQTRLDSQRMVNQPAQTLSTAPMDIQSKTMVEHLSLSDQTLNARIPSLIANRDNRLLFSILKTPKIRAIETPLLGEILRRLIVSEFRREAPVLVYRELMRRNPPSSSRGIPNKSQDPDDDQVKRNDVV